MLVVGVTGRSGSGKTAVTEYYASLGYPTLDGDKLSREVTQPGSPVLAQLAEVFGADIISADGSLLRRKLAQKAFASPDATRQLTALTHPAILAEVKAGICAARQAGAALLFLDGAVIVGSAFEAYCDKLIVVTSEQRLAVSRIILRDGISKQAAAQRLAAQQSEEVLLQAADYVIENNADLPSLLARAGQVLQALLARAEK